MLSHDKHFQTNYQHQQKYKMMNLCFQSRILNINYHQTKFTFTTPLKNKDKDKDRDKDRGKDPFLNKCIFLEDCIISQKYCSLTRESERAESNFAISLKAVLRSVLSHFF